METLRQWVRRGGPPPRGLERLEPVARVSPSATRVLCDNAGAFTLQGTNTYVVCGERDAKSAVLVDSGEAGVSGYADAVAEVLQERGLELSAVLLTHHHADHVGGVGALRERFGEGLAVHKRRRHGHAEDEQYLDIADGQVFEAGGVTLRAVHTPGHTADHVCFVLQEDGAVLAGDCLLGSGQTPVFEDYVAYLGSLARLRAELAARPGPLLCAHGAVVEDGLAYVDKYLAHRAGRDESILDALRRAGGAARTASQLTQDVYAHVPLLVRIGATKVLTQHLENLIAKGAVERVRRAPRALEALPTLGPLLACTIDSYRLAG